MENPLSNKKHTEIDLDFFSRHDSKKSIILYNPISGKGHFDSWCALFAKCLVNKGWKICIVTPDASAISAELAGLNQNYKRNILILDPHIQLPLAPFSQKLADHHLLKTLQKHLITKADPCSHCLPSFLTRVDQALRRRALAVLKFLFRPSLRISAHSPVVFAKDLQLINRTFRGEPKIALNMYLDIYSNTPSDWKLFNQKIDNKWSTIHIDTSNTLQEISKQNLKNLEVIFYINEDLPLAMMNKNSSPAYHWIPDVATPTLPNQNTSLTERIKKQASHRKIVFLGGAIGGTKNLSAWYQVINRCPPDKLFFVQAGVVNRSTLSENDLIELKKIEQSPPENLLIHDHYLQNDSEFNQLISISDIIWGLYRDFDRSSNILGKSAVFRKPILVSDKYLMGQRVRQYNIGLAMDESDSHQIAASLEALLLRPPAVSNFDRYAQEHGELALSEKIDQYLSNLI